MRKGKYSKRGMATKTLVLLLTLTLLLGGVVGGTIAWLTSQSNAVVNTFSGSDVTVGIEETTGNTYKMIPGWTIDKNPKAWVTEDSEDCYLFVTVKKENNFDTYMTYAIAEGWTKLESASDTTTAVYYRIFEADDTQNQNAKGTKYSILAGDKVTVLDTVTKEMMEALTEDTYPKLTFQAYAIQLNSSNDTEFTPIDAWNQLNGN